LRLGSADGISPKPPFRPLRLEAEAKRQTAKEPEKMSARTLFWSEAGFSFSCLNCFYLLSYACTEVYQNNLMLPNYGK